MNADSPMSLRGWLDREKIPDQDFAERVGISASHLSLIVARRRSASLELAIKIGEETGGVITPSMLVAEKQEKPARSAAAKKRRAARR